MKNIKINIALLLILALSSTLLFAANGYNVSFSQPTTGEINLDFGLENYIVEQITKNGVTYSTINFENSVTTKKTGFAELPFIHAAVQLSKTKNVTTEIIANNYVEYQLDHPLLPSRGTIYRDQDPSSIPYEIKNESIVDEFYPGNIAEAMEPFIIRDVRGSIVYVYPFQYNAEQNILRVFENVTVKLTENSSTPINPINNASERMTKAMNSLYRSVFINYTETRFEHELDEFGSILVIHTPRDADAIAPYIEWKREKGFTVYAEEVATGTNVTSLVSSQFSSHDDILYVQIVGDWNDISGTTIGGTATDPTLGCLVGGDNYPDLIVGRFSASYADQVTTQVNKAIGYEKTPELGGDWYSKGLGIGSEQGSGIGDDGEADYVHIDVIKDDKLLPFTYTEVAEAYQFPSQTLVSGPVNEGLTIINYCGHGSTTSWVTSGFNNSSVDNLSNGDKLPFIISVACVNGNFQTNECFAEAWLHKSGGGAVGMLASTINMSWAPPMRGQDYINDLLIGGYDYAAHPGQNGITTDVQKTTYGAVCFNGSILMVVEDYSGGLDEMQHWTIFGDAALQVRTDTPQELSLSNTAVLMGIDFATTITSGGTPIEGAMVTLSQDGEVFSGISDENGNVSIAHELNAGICTMVVTGFNTETIYADDVAVIPPGGPYVIFESYTIDDTATGNGNGSLENGEIVDIDMSVENLG
ncbi:MAG: C25 family cysteine peptidase, partial [Candidatus Cloacimonetes bacterium]|nr:C25 family cysteine peptidase [Candidatus Cloacimonadota bacterium]